MKKIALLMILVVAFCLASPAQATYNYNAKFQLHYAGPHSSKTNTCDFTVSNCSAEIVTDGGGPGKFDVYLIAIDTQGIAGARYGIACTGADFYFYGWTNCADLEIPTDNWPGCGEGNAQTFFVEQGAGHVTLGIFYIYVYDTATTMCTDADPRKGFAEWCDGTAPDPLCNQTDEVSLPARDLYFGCVGFNGTSGVSNCDEITVDKQSWGAIKALYR